MNRVKDMWQVIASGNPKIDLIESFATMAEAHAEELELMCGEGDAKFLLIAQDWRKIADRTDEVVKKLEEEEEQNV